MIITLCIGELDTIDRDSIVSIVEEHEDGMIEVTDGSVTDFYKHEELMEI